MYVDVVRQGFDNLTLGPLEIVREQCRPAINLDKAYEPCYSGGPTEMESKAGMIDNESSKFSAKGEELALPPGYVVSLNLRTLSAANLR